MDKEWNLHNLREIIGKLFNSIRVNFAEKFLGQRSFQSQAELESLIGYENHPVCKLSFCSNRHAVRISSKFIDSKAIRGLWFKLKVFSFTESYRVIPRLQSLQYKLNKT